MLTIYSKTTCPHCDSAKKYLESKNVEFEVINIEEDAEARQFLVDHGHRSVPQIYKGNELFVEGGYSALIKLTEDEIKAKL
jgi:glutaredoxin 3